MLSRLLGSERDFDNVRKSGLCACGKKLLDSSGELTVRRGRDHRHELFAALHRREDADDLRALHHRAERARHEAFAAEYAFRKIDFGDTALVLADGVHGTRLFAGDGGLDDRMKRTDRDTLSAFDAFVGMGKFLTVNIPVFALLCRFQIRI